MNVAPWVPIGDQIELVAILVFVDIIFKSIQSNDEYNWTPFIVVLKIMGGQFTTVFK